MNINLITIGKLKEDYLKAASIEYIKRTSAYAAVKVYELDEYRLSDKPSQKEIENALSAEAALIQKLLIQNKGYNIALCVEGKTSSSENFSKMLDNISVSGKSTINFIIGSSFGLSQEIKVLSDFRLSISEMTFPHQLLRVILLEQIYRAFQISSGGKYHK